MTTVGSAVINCYESNTKLLGLYDALKDKHLGILSVISRIYAVSWKDLSLSKYEIYSLLTVLTHTIVRYVSEKEDEVMSKGIQIFKHVIPDRLLTVWCYAYEYLSKVDNEWSININNWIQILWLNNFNLIDNCMSINSIQPIFTISSNSISAAQDLDFIKRLIYLEASSRIESSDIDKKRIDWSNQMAPHMYENMVIKPFKLFNSINYSNHQDAQTIELILNNISLSPVLPILQQRFAELIPRHISNEAIDINDIPFMC